jgi:hypothetical protein
MPDRDRAITGVCEVPIGRGQDLSCGIDFGDYGEGQVRSR